MVEHEYIPASKKAVYLDKQMFATIMCMIRKRRGYGRAVSLFYSVSHSNSRSTVQILSFLTIFVKREREA